MPETGYAETVGIAENAQIWADAVPDIVVEGWVPVPVPGQRAVDVSPGIGVSAFQRSETVVTVRVTAPPLSGGALGQWFALTCHRRWLESDGSSEAGETDFRLVPAETTTAAVPVEPPLGGFESWLRDTEGNPRENTPGVEYDQILDWFWWPQASTVPVRFAARSQRSPSGRWYSISPRPGWSFAAREGYPSLRGRAELDGDVRLVGAAIKGAGGWADGDVIGSIPLTLPAPLHRTPIAGRAVTATNAQGEPTLTCIANPDRTIQVYRAPTDGRWLILNGEYPYR